MDALEPQRLVKYFPAIVVDLLLLQCEADLSPNDVNEF